MTGVTGAVGEPWVVQAPTGRSAGDHVCWPFRDRGELAAVARAFVAEGLGRHERVAYVGQGRPRELRHDLAGISNLQDCLDRGQLQVSDIAAMPASDPAADPVDRLCAFDAAALGEGLLGELGCVHTLTHGELSPFQLCAARGADAALVGSVDAFSIAQLLEALRRIGVPQPGGQAVLDATALEFVDVRALRDLDGHAADAGSTLVLRSPPDFVLRLMELLGVRAVRV